MGTIDTFNQNFGEGQRVSQFIVRGPFVNNSGSATSYEDTELVVKSAQYPASNIGVVEVPYRGRKVKRPGDRVFNEWNISVLLQQNHHIYDRFVEWMNSINPHNSVTRPHTNAIMWNWDVYSLGPDGVENESTRITLVNAFPSEVGTVDFNWETTDTTAEFSVTMQYDYWTKSGATT